MLPSSLTINSEPYCRFHTPVSVLRPDKGVLLKMFRSLLNDGVTFLTGLRIFLIKLLPSTPVRLPEQSLSRVGWVKSTPRNFSHPFHLISYTPYTEVWRDTMGPSTIIHKDKIKRTFPFDLRSWVVGIKPQTSTQRLENRKFKRH